LDPPARVVLLSRGLWLPEFGRPCAAPRPPPGVGVAPPARLDPPGAGRERRGCATFRSSGGVARGGRAARRRGVARHAAPGGAAGPTGRVFRAPLGLPARFGSRRAMDTPLAETLITGIAVGMAAQGLRPVAEIQFMGFIYPGMEQLVSRASRLRSRTRGRL